MVVEKKQVTPKNIPKFASFSIVKMDTQVILTDKPEGHEK